MTHVVSTTRHLLHSRSIIVDGFSRDDGNWELEARLLDVKAYDMQGLYRRNIPAGEPIHDIRVRVVVDDGLTILSIHTAIDNAPFPMCADITPKFDALVGVPLGAGFMRELRANFGGVRGCTHLCELLGAVATTAFQTIYPVLRRELGQPQGRPSLMDSCHSLRAEGEVAAKLWPDHALSPVNPDHDSNT